MVPALFKSISVKSLMRHSSCLNCEILQNKLSYVLLHILAQIKHLSSRENNEGKAEEDQTNTQKGKHQLSWSMSTIQG